MANVITILLCGISVAPFLFVPIDIWHSQGLWVQGGVLLLFSMMLMTRSRRPAPVNKPLGILHVWIAFTLLIILYKSLYTNQYPVWTILPYLNFLTMLIFYIAIVQYLNKKDIIKILEYLRYVVAITLIITALQYFGLGQFFIRVSPKESLENSLVTGLIGNGTHLSGFLGMCAPLFMIRRTRENFLCLTLMFLLMFFTGSQIGKPSMSGFIILVILSLIYTYKYYRKFLGGYIFLLIVGWIAGCFIAGEENIKGFLETGGRFKWWAYYWGVFKANSILGLGLGKINATHLLTPIPGLNHLHLEYFQYAVELGLIGLIAIINLMKKFLEIKTKDDVEFALKMCVLGFFISCLFNFASHLWLTATFATFFYASLIVIDDDNKEFPLWCLAEKKSEIPS